jgi:hypothetical protein
MTHGGATVLVDKFCGLHVDVNSCLGRVTLAATTDSRRRMASSSATEYPKRTGLHE